MKLALLISACALSLLATSASAGYIGSGGVKEVYDAGTKSSKGHTKYVIRCNSGSRMTVYQDGSGKWFDDGGSAISDRFKNLSVRDFAEQACN
jgi:hypothetical protein